MPAASLPPTGDGNVRYMDRRDIFAEHAFFRGLAPRALDELVARSRIEHCRRGKTIFRPQSLEFATGPNDVANCATHFRYLLQCGLGPQALKRVFVPAFFRTEKPCQ